MGFLSGHALVGLGKGISGAGEAFAEGIAAKGRLDAKKAEKDLEAQREINLEKWKKAHGHSSYQTKSDGTTAGGWKLKDAASATDRFLKNYYAQESGALDWDADKQSEYSSRNSFINSGLTGGVKVGDEVMKFSSPGEANEAYSDILTRIQEKAAAADAESAAVSQATGEEQPGFWDSIIDSLPGEDSYLVAGIKMLAGREDITPEQRDAWAKAGENFSEVFEYIFAPDSQQETTKKPQLPEGVTAIEVYNQAREQIKKTPHIEGKIRARIKAMGLDDSQI